MPQQSSCLIQSEQTKALKAGVQHRDRRQYGQQIVHDKHRDGDPIRPLKKNALVCLKHEGKMLAAMQISKNHTCAIAFSRNLNDFLDLFSHGCSALFFSYSPME